MVRMLGPGVRLARASRVATLTTREARLVPGCKEHRAIKRAVARRSRGLCECARCRQSGTPLPAHDFDHAIPLWEGGDNALANWQHLNRECHKRKSAAEHRRRLGLAPLPTD